MLNRKLKRRQISGSYFVALETCQLLMRVISAARWNNTNQLIEQIRQLGKTLINAQPREFTCGNIIRRVLAIIRDEVYETTENENMTPMISSMFSLLSTNVEKKEPIAPPVPTNPRIHHNKNHDLRSIIIQGIRDLIDEISNIDDGIEAMSVDLIHDNEILLTPTPDSKTVLKFLLKARQKRKFTVLVTECFPNRTSIAHSFAKELSDAKIDTVVIPDSHVFAVMSRVGKVIVGARSVFANGGTVSSAGVAAVAECAKEHKTPVFSVAGLYKLSPTYPFDVENLIEVGNSGKVINFSESNLVQHADITNPLFDYIPPEHIDIYITNMYVFIHPFPVVFWAKFY
ncbi:Methylthioribose-1-phosphate isomerase [Wickerhamomyces ciferrii]|uniref:Translation initiation factor eIF2B subunit beta n=1 Tax=Wickerhamomyces ciferrii (strain ATCC 14091 / BCRC 22168 / CBS 111 / JCM 3599 / NBRC 0793 / NRRL Y-1031 F-60-10) TaxID=1206466 RepID=K0KHS9_WICCF|nr:Methylthioribose-1-phosphate isomerase [Wickerhamomyces ciferrii]CCH41722.1 Methylthioribose-1-phosphate isomerase [Wickerhamomyces ciferrii]